MTIVLFLHANVTTYFLILVSKGNLTPLLSYFLVKKYLLVGASSMLWTDQWINQWVSESVSQWVRDVCMSHQSDRVYYKQPIKFIVLKVNGMWEHSIPIQFRTAIFILLFILLWVMLRILVTDEMSLEVRYFYF